MTFDFPILVDEGGHVAAAYGCQKESGGIQRTVFLIDKAGVIRWSQEGRPETETILAAIDEL
jgi:peroxiredoxin